MEFERLHPIGVQYIMMSPGSPFSFRFIPSFSPKLASSSLETWTVPQPRLNSSHLAISAFIGVYSIFIVSSYLPVFQVICSCCWPSSRSEGAALFFCCFRHNWPARKEEGTLNGVCPIQDLLWILFVVLFSKFCILTNSCLDTFYIGQTCLCLQHAPVKHFILINSLVYSLSHQKLICLLKTDLLSKSPNH